ncbi:hypothetical protein [Hyphomicrobium sp.]|uniref:hypothetical protein n=1 Tax=Hyphomicrobium sp. TaxID=82 RepID=UPI002FDF1B18
MIFADEIRSRLKWGLERYFNQMPSEVAEEITQFHAAIGSAPAYCIEETALQFLFSVVPNTMALQVKASEVNLPFDRVFVETRSAFTVPGHWKTGTLICKQSDRIELFEFFDFDIGDLSGEVGLDRRLLGMVEEAKRGQTDKMRFAFSIPMNRKVMLLDGDIGQEGVQPTQAGIWARQTFKMDTVADVFRQNSDMSRRSRPSRWCNFPDGLRA